MLKKSFIALLILALFACALTSESDPDDFMNEGTEKGSMDKDQDDFGMEAEIDGEVSEIKHQIEDFQQHPEEMTQDDKDYLKERVESLKELGDIKQGLPEIVEQLLITIDSLESVPEKSAEADL
jgi:major membrane immunogen (membrane-anchored lipoprotein)